MNWQGEIPSEDDWSRDVDRNFFLNFLKTRPYMPRQRLSQQPTINTFCDALFDQAVDKGDGWLYYGMKFHSVKKVALEGRLKDGWRLGFHASRMQCAHSVLCNGLKEGPDKKQSCPGVYHLDRLMRGSVYHRYQLFADGTAYCVVWYLLVDPEKTLRIPGKNSKKKKSGSTATRSLERKHEKDQWVTEESGVMILGCYVRGYTMSQIRGFCRNNNQARAKEIGSFVTQWQPRNELMLDN